MYLKKQSTLIAVFYLLLVYACHPDTEYNRIFSCENSPTLQSLETQTDFQNRFSLTLPKHWNTKLYYDNMQSEIISADTTKSLTNTFILDISLLQATINIDENLRKKIQEKNAQNQLTTLKSRFHHFKGNSTFTILSSGEKNQYPFQILQSYIKVSPKQYAYIKVEFYGKEQVNTRLCEAINIINTFTIINTKNNN